jgi:hypothetical protein
MLSEVEIRRDTGIARAAARADREIPQWSDLAFEFITRYCIANGKGHEFHGEALRQCAERTGLIPEPPDARAYGSVFRRAARAGLIRKTGRYVLAKSSNLSPKPVWEVL